MSRVEPPAGPRPIRFPEMLPNRWARLGLYAAFWTVLGLLNAASAVIENLNDPRFQLWEPVVWEMSSLYTTGLLCPLVVYFTRRYRLSWSNWYWLVPAHVAAMVLFSLAHTTGMVTLRKTFYLLLGDSYQFGSQSLWVELLYEFYKDVSLYWIIVLLALGFEYYNKYRQQQLEASALESRLAQARLSNLENQLNPHFLFNTLHMISSLVHREPDRAEEMIARLSDLLRLALENSSRSQIPLREERRALGLYLEIMQARFGDRVRVSQRFDPETLDVPVPLLILQPLVENAYRHGVSGKTEGGAIEVTSRAENGRLHLAVRDNGPGLSGSSGSAQGVGLFNTSERLRMLYGDAHDLEAGNLAPGALPAPFHAGGFEARVTIPLQPEEGVK